jgi:hypothetical protein
MNQAHGGADKTVWGIDDGTPQYFNIVAKLPSMTSVWDKTTWTQYAYFDNGGLVSFDNENAICAKVQYAIENNLGGFIIWELSGDVMEDLSTPLLDITNEKLHNPNLNCGEPGYYPETTAAIPPATPETSQGVDVPASGDQTTPSVSWGIPPTPVSFPTPAVPVSSSENIETSTAMVADQPGYDGPINSQIDYGKGNGYPGNNYGKGNGYPGNNQSLGEPVQLLCGDRPDTFDASDLQAVQLSYRYELHSHPRVSEHDVMKEVKDSLLNELGGKLNCASTIREGRSLRSNPLQTSEQHVFAIESADSDIPDDSTPCSIPVSINAPAVCRSMIGSLTVGVDKEASVEQLAQIEDELLFWIRTSMAAGTYESTTIAKVIYIDNLNEPLASAPPNTQIVWMPQDAGGPSSMFVIVLCFLIVLLVGIVIFALIYVRRKKRDEYHIAQDSTNEGLDGKQDEYGTPTMQTSSTEEAWKKSLDTEETWKKAMFAYNINPSSSDSTEEETHPYADSDGIRVAPSAKGDTGEGHSSLDTSEQRADRQAGLEPNSISETDKLPDENEDDKAQDDPVGMFGDVYKELASDDEKNKEKSEQPSSFILDEEDFCPNSTGTRASDKKPPVDAPETSNEGTSNSEVRGMEPEDYDLD